MHSARETRVESVPERPLLAVLRGERRDPPPVWLMRQAGRYLPEYRALRERQGGFLAMCYDPAVAAEITLQPIRRFGFDGAILFSDILVIPHALGQNLWFEAGEGPKLAPPLDRPPERSPERSTAALLDGLVTDPARLEPIYETVRRTVAALPARVTMLGFAGSPWTVATYMIAGEGSKDQAAARALAYRDPAAFGVLIDAIVTLSIDYLCGQIDAGVDAVQLFDSWAGSLAPQQFRRWVIEPNARIVAALHDCRPGVPVIGFPKGIGGKLAEYAIATKVDAIGLDETIDPAWADGILPKDLPVQGNLDPLALVAGGAPLDAAIDGIRAALAGRPHVFNLGHGIVPQTPVVHVERLLARLRV